MRQLRQFDRFEPKGPIRLVAISSNKQWTESIQESSYLCRNATVCRRLQLIHSMVGTALPMITFILLGGHCQVLLLRGQQVHIRLLADVLVFLNVSDCKNLARRAVVVALLADRSLVTQEDPDSNPAVSNLLRIFIHC